MADETVKRKNNLVRKVQQISTTVSLTHDQVQDLIEEYNALNSVEPFDSTYFTTESANLAVDKAQFDAAAQVLIGFLAYIDEEGQDRKGKLLRVKLTG